MHEFQAVFRFGLVVVERRPRRNLRRRRRNQVAERGKVFCLPYHVGREEDHEQVQGGSDNENEL